MTAFIPRNWFSLQLRLSMIWTPAEFATHWIYNCFCATSTNLSFPSSFVLWLWTRQWVFLMRNGAGSISLWKWTSWTPTPWGLSSDRLATSFAAPSLMPSLWSVIWSFKHESQQPICRYYWRSVSIPPPLHTGILPRWQQTWKRGRVQPLQGSQPLLPLQAWWASLSWPLIS